MKSNRLEEIKSVALNEITHRGQAAGWKRLQLSYRIYEFTDEEAQLLAYLVQYADVRLPEPPERYLYV